MSVFIFQIISVLEVVLVNMTLFHANAKPKYKTGFIILMLNAFTCLIIPAGVIIMKYLGIYGNGDAIFTLFGFFYLIPLHYLYRESITKQFFIVSFCWVYTLLICSLAIQVSFLIPLAGKHYIILASETVFFLLTYRFVLHYTRRVYLSLSKYTDKTLSYDLNRASLVWFSTILIVDLQFVYAQNHLLKIITVLMIGLNILFNFELIKEILKREKVIGSLENQVAMDPLTNTGNRLGFKNIFYQKAEQEKSFLIIYFDLDNFKGINDTYGHAAGDIYLQEFAIRLKEIAGHNNVFRISGDEFAAFTTEDMMDEVVIKVRRMHFILGRGRMKFNGVSYGIVKYPDDGMDYRLLMDMADKKMYDMKMKAN